MASRIIATNELVTGPAAAEMLRRSLRDISAPLEALDNACGGGVLTAELLKLVAERPNELTVKSVIASDIDPNMVNYVENRKAVSGWMNVGVMTGDQHGMSLPDNTFTHVFNNFGIFFSFRDQAVLSETLRVMKPGGVAVFTSWRDIPWWSSFAVPALKKYLPDAPSLPDPITIFPAPDWNDPTAIRASMEASGFEEVDVSEYLFAPQAPAEEFAEACTALTKGVLARRFWSEEDNKKFADDIQLAYLRYLLETYPNGVWDGEMPAIISIGKKKR